jgi:uncharacterized protein (TIRG00374 family)
MTDESESNSSRSLLRELASSRWVKIAIAVCIVYLLVRFNRLNWNALAGLRDTWPWLLLSFALMLPPFLIVSYRFQLLLRSQRIDVSFPLALRWTMIGSLFDLSMPSSNGGDVVKAGYVAAYVGSGMRIRAVAAVAMDRVLGLLGLFLLAGIVSVFNWHVVSAMPGGAFLLLTSLATTFGVLAAFRLLGSRRLYQHRWLNLQLESSSIGKRIRQIVAAFNELREQPSYLFSALGLSVLNHVFWCVSLICIARAVGYEVQPIKAFAVFPLAIFGNVFGVAGGFGVGTAGFDFILSALLGIGNGALIGLIFQTLSSASKLGGVPFYLASSKSAVRDDDMKQT